ncbi:MAG: biotin transporter BioY [Acidobacteriales bacterium]|nr:biotin transporter BioY [Terriglobales bacterium]
MPPVSKAEAVALQSESPSYRIAREVLLVIGASLFVALCARVTLPLPFTPVPLSLQNFAVLLVGLLLGSRRGLAALVLYLAEGAAGLPVFAAGSAGLFGPTGGYLVAYPAVAFVAGWLREHSQRSFARYALACVAAEILLFAAGVSWLMIAFRQPFAQAAAFGLYPFLAAEVVKVSAAAGIAVRWHKKTL